MKQTKKTLDLTSLKAFNSKWKLEFCNGILYAKQYKTIPIFSNQLINTYRI